MSTVITSVEGNGQWLDGGSMFGNAPRAVWSKWAPPDERNRIPLACRCLLIEFGGHRILLETGIGAFFDAKMAERYGVSDPDRHVLVENLATLGLAPKDIDMVILSHLHFDHAGGLLPTRAEIDAGHDGLIFDRATFVVGRAAWARAKAPHPRDRASFIPDLPAKLAKTGRLVVVGDDAVPNEIFGRVEFIFTDGHTPGQMHTLFRGENEKVFFCGDLVPGLPWVHVPITMGYDRFPERSIDEKTAAYARAEPERWLMFFTHDPRYAAAHLGRGLADAFVGKDPVASFRRRPL